jgi:hypothetical protein
MHPIPLLLVCALHEESGGAVVAWEEPLQRLGRAELEVFPDRLRPAQGFTVPRSVGHEEGTCSRQHSSCASIAPS